ncbi:MAG: glycosyltransferase family 39 protein [Cytophagaceae bacterium]|nr:glycosyltransferase family 39 protein [Cytophagaceae bacterium]
MIEDYFHRWVVRKNAPYWYLVLFACLLISNSFFQLWDQDESAYAGMARTMLESGNWVYPEFVWSDVHRKPPFHLWHIASCFYVFGIHEFSVRLSSILYITGCLWLLYLISKDLFDAKIGVVSMVIISTTIFIPMLGRVAVTDGTLLFYSTLCVFALHKHLRAYSIRWVVLFWFSFSLALLTKGPPVIVFSGILGTLLLIFYPDRKRVLSLHPWFFFPLAILPVVGWAMLANQQDGGKLIDWMIYHYVWKRIDNSVFGQTGPPGTHVVFILISFLPFLWYLTSSIKNGYKEFRKKNKVFIFLLCWFVAAWLIYEFSPSKLPSYTALAHLPLAILIAWVACTQRVTFTLLPWLLLLLFGILFLALPFILSFSLLVQIVWVSAGMFILLYYIFIFLKFRNSTILLSYVLSGALLMQLLFTCLIIPSFEWLKLSTAKVAIMASATAKNGTVYIGNDTGLPPSLPYYLLKQGAAYKTTYFLSDWLKAWYDEEQSTFVLSEDQWMIMKGFIQAPMPHTIESYWLEKNKYFNYYLIHDSIEINTTSAVPVVIPECPKSSAYYERSIRDSEEYMKLMEEKAKQKQQPIDSVIKDDAAYLYNLDSNVYEIKSHMLKSSSWMRFLNAKAEERQIPLLSLMDEQAKAILNHRDIHPK